MKHYHALAAKISSLKPCTVIFFLFVAVAIGATLKPEHIAWTL
jgi:hypothetical protein